MQTPLGSALHEDAESPGDDRNTDDDNRTTVGAWLKIWLDTIAVRRVRSRTLESYRSTLYRHVIPPLGDVSLRELTPEDIEGLLSAMEAGGLAPATVVRTLHVLGRALKVAGQRGRVERNVVALVDAPPLRRASTPIPLSPAEARQVLDAAQTHRNAARWLVALATGLRQSEVLALGWSDLDLDAGTLLVRRGLHRVAGRGLIFEEPKSDRSRRTLVLAAPVIAALTEHRRTQYAERSDAGTAWEEHDLVFCQPTGRPIDRRADHRAWTRLLLEAGVRHVRLHDARHGVATILLADGVPARVVADLLGHSGTKITLDVYSHVLPPMARDASNRMSAALFGEVDTRRTDA